MLEHDVNTNTVTTVDITVSVGRLESTESTRSSRLNESTRVDSTVSIGFTRTCQGALASIYLKPPVTGPVPLSHKQSTPPALPVQEQQCLPP